MGNIVTIVKRFSHNNFDAVPFRRYPSLSNGTPSTQRLDKCTSDKDSSVTGKTASAINTCADGRESVCKAVDNETIDLTTCSSSRSGRFTLSIAHTEPSGGEEQGQGKPNETIHTDAIEHQSVSRPSIAGFKSIPEDSGNFEMVAFEDTAVCNPLDVRGPESNPNTSLKSQAKRKRTSRKASAKKIVPTGKVGSTASPDVKYHEMVRSPLTRSKAMALSVSTPEYHRLRSTRMGQLAVPPSDSGSQNIICDVAKLPIIPFVEQSSADKALELTPLMIRTPLPHVQSSHTPGKAMVQSVPTLQTLQLRRSTKGRLIVPRLDRGTQEIIYNMDGICGVTDTRPQLPRGCDSEPPGKRRRNQNDTMRPEDVGELEDGSHLVSSNPDCMPSNLENGNASAGNSEDLVSKSPLTAVPSEKTNCYSEISDALQSLEPLSCQSTPVASLGQVSLKRTELITLNQKAVPNEDTSTPVQSDAQSLEKTVVPAGKQRSAQKRSSPTRSRMNRCPTPYAFHAPLTRGRAHSLSISTPESLKMKKTRSGRLVVPTLDPGSERIVYNTDGMISGVSPVFQSPSSLTGGPARKRKRKAL